MSRNHFLSTAHIALTITGGKIINNDKYTIYHFQFAIHFDFFHSLLAMVRKTRKYLPNNCFLSCQSIRKLSSPLLDKREIKFPLEPPFPNT